MSAGSRGPSGIVLGREIFGDLWQALPAGGEDPSPSPHLTGCEDRECVPVSAGCPLQCRGPRGFPTRPGAGLPVSKVLRQL